MKKTIVAVAIIAVLGVSQALPLYGGAGTDVGVPPASGGGFAQPALEEPVRTHDEGSTHETRGGHSEEPREGHGSGGLAGDVLEVTLHVVESGGLAFDQAVIEIPVGRRVMVSLVNDGQLEHDFEVAQLPAEQVEAVHKMEGRSQMDGGYHKEGVVAAHAMSGMKALVMFTPLEPGEYEFYCTIPGHKEAGMVGKLVVHR